MQRVKNPREKAVEMKLDEMLQWYAANSGGKFPEHVCEDKKAYRGKVLRWLEPMLPGVQNIIMIEEFVGDSWTLRFEPCQQKIVNLR